MAASVVIAACGSNAGGSGGSGGSSNARKLLTETFSGTHPVNSGLLSATITITPTGSSRVTGPVSLSFSGPFQSRGKGKLPESDFTIAIHFDGHTGRLSILSTGTEGFVVLSGTAYKLPAADFEKLESGVSSVGGGSGAGGSTLSNLGIHPQEWLTDPTVAGTAQVGGASTDHITGKVALGPLLSDFSKIIAKASSESTSTSELKSITPADQAKIKQEVTNASFDLWTGTSDHTVRRLSVAATIPVTGKTSSELGGMTSARFALEFGYSDIGQPETVAAPTTSEPYAQFEQKISAVLLEVEELAESYAESSSSAAGSTSTTGSSSSGSSSSSDSSYSQCVTAAGGDVSKLQKCASLLNGG